MELIEHSNTYISVYIAILMLLLTIIIHGLVIFKKIPYTWINGGRSKSYEAQRKQSIVGIISLIIVIPILLVAGNIITVNFPSIVFSIINILLWIMVVSLVANTIMQLMGTKFERYVMSIIAFILLICVFIIAT